MAQSLSGTPETVTCTDQDIRCARIVGTGPLADLAARTLVADGWTIAEPAASQAASWLIAVAQAGDAAATIDTVRAFAVSAAALEPGDAPGGIVIVLDVSHMQPRADAPLPSFEAALAPRTLWNATRILALELAPRWRVNAIGVVDLMAQPDAGYADDIAAALRFIIDATALTGQIIALDAGLTSLAPVLGLEP